MPNDAALPGFRLNAWLAAWLIAFPVVLVVAPMTHRRAGRIPRQA